MNDILKIIDKTSIDEIKMLNNTNPNAKEEFINDDSLIKPSNVYDDLDICLVEKNIKKIVKAVNEVDIKTFEGSLLSKLLFNNLHKNDLVLPVILYLQPDKVLTALEVFRLCPFHVLIIDYHTYLLSAVQFHNRYPGRGLTS